MSKPTIEARLEKLADLTADEISELESDINAAYDAADESDDLDTMDSMVRHLEAVYKHKENPPPEVKAEDEAVEDTKSEDEAPSEETAADAEPETETEPAEAEPEKVEPEVEPETKEQPGEGGSKVDKVDDKVDDTAEDKTTEDKTEDAAGDDNVVELKSEDATEDQATTDNTEESTAMAASADFQPPEDAKPVVASAGLTVRAAADVADISAGSNFTGLAQVNEAMVSKIRSIGRSSGGDGQQMPVATVVASIPEDRQLTRGDVEENMARIERVTDPLNFVRPDADAQGLVAAGGYCAPLQVKYDIFGLGSTARPIRDGLPSFGAARGGIRYVAPPKLGDYTDAVGLWTAENDADPATTGDPGSEVVTPKNKKIVQCAAELTADVDAVTLQLQFGNLMSRAFPELVQRHNQLALIEHARFAERNLLSQISAGSTAVTSAFKVGTARDFLLAIAKAGAAYRNRHRVARTTPLRVIAPEWVLDAMREDLTQQLPGDNTYAMSDAIISSFLAARNINVTWHMDAVFPSQGAGALVDFPATIEWFIFAEGTWLFLDGGTLDLGVVRDSGLVGTNDYITFVETFEGTAKVGIESIKVTTTTHVTGGSVGTIAVA